jgi:hypothetical protein
MVARKRDGLLVLPSDRSMLSVGAKICRLFCGLGKDVCLGDAFVRGSFCLGQDFSLGAALARETRSVARETRSVACFLAGSFTEVR